MAPYSSLTLGTPTEWARHCLHWTKYFSESFLSTRSTPPSAPLLVSATWYPWSLNPSPTSISNSRHVMASSASTDWLFATPASSFARFLRRTAETTEEMRNAAGTKYWALVEIPIAMLLTMEDTSKVVPGCHVETQCSTP